MFHPDVISEKIDLSCHQIFQSTGAEELIADIHEPVGEKGENYLTLKMAAGGCPTFPKGIRHVYFTSEGVYASLVAFSNDPPAIQLATRWSI